MENLAFSAFPYTCYYCLPACLQGEAGGGGRRRRAWKDRGGSGWGRADRTVSASACCVLPHEMGREEGGRGGGGPVLVGWRGAERILLPVYLVMHSCLPVYTYACLPSACIVCTFSYLPACHASYRREEEGGHLPTPPSPPSISTVGRKKNKSLRPASTSFLPLQLPQLKKKKKPTSIEL